MTLHRTRTLLLLAAALVLCTGMGGAFMVYLSAGNPPDSGMIDEFLASKRYAHELKAYGGNAALVADEICRWLESLWYGKALAYTIASLTVSISCTLLFAARHVPLAPADPEEESGEDGRS